MNDSDSRPQPDPAEAGEMTGAVEQAVRSVAALELDTGRPETTALLRALGAATARLLSGAPASAGSADGDRGAGP